MKAGSKNLTEGPIIISVLEVAIPIFLSQFLQNLYNSVDSLVVGNFVGKTALAAVTSCSDISRLMTGFFTGLSVGSGVVFSRCFGSGNHKKLHDSIHTSLPFAAILGAVMAVLGILLSPAMFALVKCPADVLPLSLTYMRIYLIGIFFSSIYNIMAGVLRAVGDTRTPLYFLVICCTNNILLDVLFVAVFGMGVAGVALATILSQMVSVFLIGRKMLFTTDVYRVTPRDFHIDPVLLKEVLRLGLPAAVQSCIIQFSNYLIQGYINMFGADGMAGIGIAKKLDQYVNEVSLSIGQATAIFVGQNSGAGKYKRSFKGVRCMLLVSCAGILLVSVPVYHFAPQLASLFNRDPAVVGIAVAMMRVMLPLYFVSAVHQVTGNAVRGYGYSVSTMFAATFGIVVARQIFLFFAMRLAPSIRHLYYAWPLGWVFSAMIDLSFYFYIKHKIKKQMASES